MSIFAIGGHLKTLIPTNLIFTARCQEPSGKKEKKAQ